MNTDNEKADIREFVKKVEYLERNRYRNNYSADMVESIDNELFIERMILEEKYGDIREDVLKMRAEVREDFQLMEMEEELRAEDTIDSEDELYPSMNIEMTLDHNFKMATSEDELTEDSLKMSMEQESLKIEGSDEAWSELKEWENLVEKMEKFIELNPTVITMFKDGVRALRKQVEEQKSNLRQHSYDFIEEYAIRLDFDNKCTEIMNELMRKRKIVENLRDYSKKK